MQSVEAALRVVDLNTDDRAAARFSLHLDVEGQAECGVTKALIYNLSQTGLRLETAANLSVGDSISLHLPEAGATDAVVVWSDHQSFGCEFHQRVSFGAISAALLKSSHEPQPSPESPFSAADQIEDNDEQSAPDGIVLVVSLLVSFAALGILVAALVGF